MKNLKSESSSIKYLFIGVVFFIAMPVLASEFSFDTQDKNVSVGQQLKIDLNINTDKESINAVGGNIVFSTDLLELSEVRSGNSIVNFWVDEPGYTNNGVLFSGITPGGYILDKGLILSLIFKAKKEGTATVKIEDGSALKNDGKGTKSKLTTSNLQINISGTSQNQTSKNFEIVDKTPPDVFQPEVSQDPNLLNNKWFVVFVAEDKDSGVARYEVRESKYIIFNSSKWVPAESPYTLKDQELRSNIFIKAIDKAGNERVVRVSPKNPIHWYTNPDYWFIIILVIIVILISLRLSKKYKNRNEII